MAATITTTPCHWTGCTKPPVAWAVFGTLNLQINHGAYCQQHLQKLQNAHHAGNLAIDGPNGYKRTADLITKPIP